MVKIYRVENKQEIGPYRGRWKHKGGKSMKDSHCPFKDHPAPPQDGISTSTMGDDWTSFKFGNPSIESLRQWFSGYEKELRRSGFKIVEIEIPEEHIRVGNSGKQVAFDSRQVVNKRKLTYNKKLDIYE